MITVGMNYRVLPGKNETFTNACRGVINLMASIEGHTASHLYQDVDDPNSYLIISDWSDREVFNGFIKSEQFAKVTNWGREQILAGRPKHEVYER
jgi:heme-degrading monooxygenase HmoA